MTGDIGKAVDELINQARSLPGEFEQVDLDGPSLRSKLLSIAGRRQPDLADLLKAHKEVEAELLLTLRHSLERHQRCRARSDALKVFYVDNTSNSRLTVLAQDAECARYFAHANGHIKDRTNGDVFVMTPEVEAELRKSGKALGRALRDGFPGVVTVLGENVVMEENKKVYTPMTIVDQARS